MKDAVAKGRENRSKIFNLLVSSPKAFTIADIRHCLNISDQSVRVHCDHLVWLGLAEQVIVDLPKRRRRGLIAYRATTQKI
jgi:predicted DNA-binding transcriptional regulator